MEPVMESRHRRPKAGRVRRRKPPRRLYDPLSPEPSDPSDRDEEDPREVEIGGGDGSSDEAK